MIQVRIRMEGVPPVQFNIDERQHPNAGFGVIAAVAALMRPDSCPIRDALEASAPLEQAST